MSCYNNLIKLTCVECYITTIINIPPSLIELKCNINYIKSFQTGFTYNLGLIECSHNLLNRLPDLPKKLEILKCAYNQLTILHELPLNLRILECAYNQLTILPDLPPNLEMLNCSGYYNKLTIEPLLNTIIFPSNLKHLVCENCNLYMGMVLSEKLEILVCGKNHIKCFDNLPKNLIELINLHCYYN